METLNEARLAIVLHQYLRDGRVLGPVEANHKEPVFLEFRRTMPIKLGVRLGELVYTSEDLNLAMKNNHKPFLIGVKCDHWELVHESHKLMDQIFQPFLKGVTCQDAPDWGHALQGECEE
ncbi:RUS family member 1-like [Oncorhynchus masou masou]|uniref:RUS family member 1-like n=1 Tax=Oncorhynchus masou masou TaxID=90313 RepID=UPI0031841D9E